MVAISDHDSTEGLPAALAAAREHSGLRVIPAIELSTDVPGSEIHILGYFIDTSDADFQRTLSQFREGRFDRGPSLGEDRRCVEVVEPQGAIGLGPRFRDETDE